MLVDANILLFATNRDSPFHTPALRWLTDALARDAPLALPWQSLGAFLRLSTHPTALAKPLTPDAAWRQVEEWLDVPHTWIPLPTVRHAPLLGGLILKYRLGGNLIADAQLAALALEHGLALASADTDFARFTEIEWVDPLAA